MEKIEIVRKYIEELISAPINLVGYKDFEEAYYYLYKDSIFAVKREDLGEKFLDVGTGGGIPGVFLAVEYDISGLLIDSICKKIEYAKDLCGKLGIKNVDLLCIRAEELKNKGDYREYFDSAVSRAVSKIATVLELTAPYVKVGGKILLYKGPGYNEELSQSIVAMKELGVKLLELREYSVRGKDRFLLVFEKFAPTPEKYPRKVGVPEKRPIK
ncbi:16S rRNA (guanine(527)-N(7))-methyltransferase RsmG [Fervidobacterium sp.]